MEKTEKEDDEISLIDLFAVLWRRKIMIITVTAVAMVGIIVFALISRELPTEKSPMPNYYTPKALVLINGGSSGGGLSSLLGGSGLGAIAALAGITGGGGNANQALALYLVGTDSMLDAVVDRFDMINKYKIEEYQRSASRQMLRSKLKAEVDTGEGDTGAGSAGVIKISFTDTDPVFARDVVQFAVQYLEDRFNAMGLDQDKIEQENLEKNIANTYEEIKRLETETHNLARTISSSWGPAAPSVALEESKLQLELEAQQQIYIQLKSQYEILKVKLASETPVFQIIEMPEVPDAKSGPSRGKMCIIVTFAAGFFSVFLAFVLNAVENLKKDPEAMAKLTNKGNKK